MNTAARRKLIESTNGKIFTVHFRKADGTIRKMNCRLGVKIHLKGGKCTTAGYDQYIAVYDVKSKGYRTINLDTLIEAKIGGKLYTF